MTRLHAQQCTPLWREQFDHAAKDYLSSLHHADHEHFVKSLCNKSWTKIQKWWEIFGKYWQISNRHNNNDVKLMCWLMNGANHGTMDTCGKNVSLMTLLIDNNNGIHLLKGGGIDNHSKLLKMELGQQIPIKSLYKIKRDLIKRARSNSSHYRGPSDMDHSCWYH